MKRYADPFEEGAPSTVNFHQFIRIHFKGPGHKRLFLEGLRTAGLRNRLKFHGKEAFFPKEELPQIEHLREHARVRQNRENIAD